MKKVNLYNDANIDILDLEYNFECIQIEFGKDNNDILLEFIRKKKNKSGSVSFHIVRKQNGRQYLVESIGSANDEIGINNRAFKAREQLNKFL